VDLNANLELDVSVRHIAALHTPAVPDYTAVDARFGWKIRPELEFVVIGQNLLDSEHPEFGAAPSRSELARGILLQILMGFPR
jgi:iron complex outermembrane recepter protein